MATAIPVSPTQRASHSGMALAPTHLRAAIADDCPLLIDGIAHALGAHGGVSVVVRAMSGADLLSGLARTDVDVVLIDPWMRSGDGLAALADLSHRPSSPIVIALSSARKPEQVDQAIALGVQGYIGKDVPSSDLPALVRRVASGVLVRPRAAAHAGPAHTLTSREREVLTLVADGLSNHDVGERLFVTEQTVKFHLGNVYRKLGAHNRTEAARKAMRAGLIT